MTGVTPKKNNHLCLRQPIEAARAIAKYARETT
jgi:hypothetical protein